MHLVYLDESGQTGTNLRDTIQPVFALGALVVPESVWLPLEKDLLAAIERSFPILAVAISDNFPSPIVWPFGMSGFASRKSTA